MSKMNSEKASPYFTDLILENLSDEDADALVEEYEKVADELGSVTIDGECISDMIDMDPEESSLFTTIVSRLSEGVPMSYGKAILLVANYGVLVEERARRKR